MFDIGIQELIVIFVVALIVFGPKRLPEIGKALGKAAGELKKAMDGVKEQVNAEMHDIKDPIALKNSIYGDNSISEAEAARDRQKADAPKSAPHEADTPKAQGTEQGRKQKEG